MAVKKIPAPEEVLGKQKRIPSPEEVLGGADVKKKEEPVQESGVSSSPSLEESTISGVGTPKYTPEEINTFNRLERNPRELMGVDKSVIARYKSFKEDQMPSKEDTYGELLVQGADLFGMINKKEVTKSDQPQELKNVLLKDVAKAASQAEYPTMYLFEVDELNKRLSKLPEYYPEARADAEALQKDLVKYTPTNIGEARKRVEALEQSSFGTSQQFQQSGSGMPVYFNPMQQAYEKFIVNDPKTAALRQILNTNKNIREAASYRDKGGLESFGAGVGKGMQEYIEGYSNLLDDLNGNRGIAELNNKLEKLKNNENVELTTDDRFMLRALQETEALSKSISKDEPFSYKIGRNTGSNMLHMLEFVATGGIGGGVAKSITKGVIKEATSLGKRMSLGAAAKLAQAGIQTAAMPSMYKGIALDVASGEDFGKSLFKNYYNTFGENLSERIFMSNPWNVGELSGINKAFRAMGTSLNTERGAFGIVRSTGEEYLEEKVSEVWQATTKYSDFSEFWDDFVSGERNLETLASVAVLTALPGTVGLTMTAPQKIATSLKTNRIGNLLEKPIREEVDVVLNDKNLTIEQQFSLIGNIVKERADSEQLGSNPAKTAGDIINYVSAKTKENVVSAIPDKEAQDGQADTSQDTTPTEQPKTTVDEVSVQEQPIAPSEEEVADKLTKETPQTQISDIENDIVEYEGATGKLIKTDQGYVVEDVDGNRTLVESGESGMSAEELGVFKTGEAPVYNPEDSKISYLGKEYTYESVNTNKEGDTLSINATDSNGKKVTIRNKFAVEEIEYQKALSEMEQSGSIEQLDEQQVDDAINELNIRTYEPTEVKEEVEPIQQAGQVTTAQETTTTEAEQISPLEATIKPSEAISQTKGVVAPQAEETALKQPKQSELQKQITDEKGTSKQAEGQQGRQEELLKAAKIVDRKARIAEVDAEIGDLWSDLADIVGAKKSITGEQRQKLAPVVSKLVSAYATKYALKGAELIDAVREHLSSRGINIDKDVEELIKAESDAKETTRATEKTGEQLQELEQGEKERLRDTEQDRKEQEKVTHPKKGQKQRGFDKTIQKAGEEYEKMVQEDPLFYDTSGLKEGIDKAVEWLSNMDIATAYEKLKKQYNSANPERQERRQVFLKYLTLKFNEYVKDKDYENANSIYKWRKDIRLALAAEYTLAGQTSSTAAAWNSYTPESAVWALELEIDTYNDKITGADTRGIQESFEDINKASKESANEATKSESVKKVVEKVVKNHDKPLVGINKAKAKDIANKVRKIKPSSWGITLAADPISAVGVGVLDGVVELVAKTIETTGDVIDAVERGIAKLKRSDWYKGLTDTQKRKIERSFRANMKSELGEKKVSGKDVSRYVKQEIKDLGETINSIIKDHWQEANEIGITLSERIKSSIDGITDKEANEIEQAVQKEFQSLMEKKLEKKIAQQYVPKQKYSKDAFITRLGKVMMMGGMTKDSFREHFAMEFGLVEDLTSQQAQEITRLHSALMQTGKMGEYSNIVAEAFARELDKYVPRTITQNFLNAMIGIDYGHMLMGTATNLVNFSSVLANLYVRPIVTLFDVNKWEEAASVGLKNKSAQSFWSMSPLVEAVERAVYAIEAIPIGLNQFMDTIKNGDIRSLHKYITEVNSAANMPIPELERHVFGNDRFSTKLKWKGNTLVDFKFNPYNYVKYAGRMLAAVDAGFTKVIEAVTMAADLRKKLVRGGYSEREILAQIQRQVFGVTLTQQEVDEVDRQMEEEKQKLNELGLTSETTASSVGKKIKSFADKIGLGRWTNEKDNKRRLEIIREKLTDYNEDELVDMNNVAKSNVFNDDRGGIFNVIFGAIGRFSNRNVSTKIATMGYFPFTKVVGNIFDFALDVPAFYGSIRRRGYGPTSIWAHTVAFNKMGDKGYISFLKAINPLQKRLPVAELPFKTSMLGDKGSRMYEEQRFRAMVGNMVIVLPAVSILAGVGVMGGEDGDGEPFIDFSGERYDIKDPQNREQQAINKGMPPHTMKIGKFKFRFHTKPILYLPLSILGNYRDMQRSGYSDNKISERMRLLGFAFAQSIGGITNNSLAGGFKEINQGIEKIVITQKALKGDPEAEQLDTKAMIKDLTEYLIKGQGNVWTGVLPTRNNLVQQTIQYIREEGKESRDIPAILAYNAGIHHWTNNDKIDLFGDVVYQKPGYTQILYAPILKEKDPRRWELFGFLSDNKSIPSPYYNRQETFILSEPKSYRAWIVGNKQTKIGENDTPIIYDKRLAGEDEFWELRHLAGQKFKQWVDNYYSNPEVWGIEKDRKSYTFSTGERTVMQDKVMKAWGEAKEQTRRYLFTWSDFKTKENAEVYDRLYKLNVMPKVETSLEVFKKEADGGLYLNENGMPEIEIVESKSVEHIAIYNSIVFSEYIESLNTEETKSLPDEAFKTNAKVRWEVIKGIGSLLYEKKTEERFSK